MADKVTLARMVRLLKIAAKIDMMWLLRDTKYAIAAISADVIANLSAVSGVFLIAVRFGGIGGMSSDEVLFMMSYSTLVTGLFILFGAQNNIHISRIIGRGQLEHLFIQPLPLKAQLICINIYGIIKKNKGKESFTLKAFASSIPAFFKGKLFLGIAIVVIASFILEPLGFMVTCFLFLLAYGYLLGDRKYVRLVVVALVVTLFLYVVFGVLLSVNLPRGTVPFLRNFALAIESILR